MWETNLFVKYLFYGINFIVTLLFLAWIWKRYLRSLVLETWEEEKRKKKELRNRLRQLQEEVSQGEQTWKDEQKEIAYLATRVSLWHVAQVRVAERSAHEEELTQRFIVAKEKKRRKLAIKKIEQQIIATKVIKQVEKAVRAFFSSQKEAENYLDLVMERLHDDA